MKRKVYNRMGDAKKVFLPIKKLCKSSHNEKEEIEGRQQVLKQALEKTRFSGCIVVVKYPDGRLVVVDGWHRVQALKEMGELLVCAMVLLIKNDEEERELHYALNMSVSHLPEEDLEKFIKSLVSPEQFGLSDIEEEIEEIVDTPSDEGEVPQLHKKNSALTIRRMVLKYTDEEYNDLRPKIEQIGQYFKCKTNSEIFLNLINEFYATAIISNKAA